MWSLMVIIGNILQNKMKVQSKVHNDDLEF